MPVRPRTVTVWVHTPLAATDQTGVANAKARVATQPAAADIRSTIDSRKNTTDRAARKAAVSAPGVSVKSSGSVPSPDSQYAGTATATTPGDRLTTRWPFGATSAAEPEWLRAMSISSVRTPSSHGEPVVAIRQEASPAP